MIKKISRTIHFCHAIWAEFCFFRVLFTFSSSLFQFFVSFFSLYVCVLALLLCEFSVRRTVEILDGCLFVVYPNGVKRAEHKKIMREYRAEKKNKEKTYRIYEYETLRVCSRRQHRSINQTQNDYCLKMHEQNITRWLLNDSHIHTTRWWRWSLYNDYTPKNNDDVTPCNRPGCLQPLIKINAQIRYIMCCCATRACFAICEH